MNRTTWEPTLSIILGYDPSTLRERVDLRAADERLEELGSLRSLSALNEKTVLLRLLGRLDEAYTVANEAVRQARFTGDREQLLGARIRRGQVLQYQGKFDEAIVELTGCVDEARGREWTALEAFAVQNRGKVHFDMQEYEAALSDMTAAVFLREKLGASPAEIEGALTAVAVVQRFLEAQRAAAGSGAGETDGGDGVGSPA
ncbi:tetratricopeptide repeat protein [Leifsonia shinshuensis]|uniref:tetratricopeptide repeat protein n=1 Tax=Leifsonia shinshuensis TaxID=150026 RepID=UPI002155FD29|nr:tetratricopeptide repeat protein [Leifsonia shinshuensis]